MKKSANALVNIVKTDAAAGVIVVTIVSAATDEFTVK